MIRHRPAGRGHPYEPDDEQRVPLLPLAGERLEIRATSDAAAHQVVLELDDGTLRPMARVGTNDRGRLRWRVELNTPDARDRLRYRLRDNAGSGRTRWHSVAVARWSTGGGWRAAMAGGRTTLIASRDDMAHGSSVTQVAPGSLTWLTSVEGTHRVRFDLRLDESERLIGFGERYDRLDQRGNRLDVRVYEPYKRQWTGSRTYLPMPFFISSVGWGGWLVTSRRACFDIGASAPDVLRIEADVDPREPGLELVLVEGTPQEVLAAFLEYSGPARLPPDWVFRPWMSANEWNTQERVMAEVRRGEQLGIPAGVLVIEAWSDETSFAIFRDAFYEPKVDGGPHRLADFDFPVDGAWPDPKGMVEALHQRGMRLVLWQVPLMKRRRDLSGQAVHDWERMMRDQYGVLRADGRPYRNQGWWFPDGLLIDFTKPAASDWWLSKRRYLVEELGVDGFKTDGGEHAWGDDLRYADGRSGAEVNNEYPVHYQAAYHHLLAEHRDDGATFSRAGFVGSARYPAFWAGDEDSTWEAFRAAIVAGQQAGASGIFFWGWDIGGFSGEIPTVELYLRSTAMAVFCPIMQYHSELNWHRRPLRDRTPWNIAERHGDPSVIELYRHFAKLRDRLVPFLVEESRHAVEAALPLMRPLAFDDPRDEAAWQHPLQYRLGRSLIVAPVTDPGAGRWTVYLPAGEWIDLWDGTSHEGSSLVERAAPLEIIPVYVSANRAKALRHDLSLS